PAHGTFDGQLDIRIGLLRRFVVLLLGGGRGLVFLPRRDGRGFVGLGCRGGLVGLGCRRTYFGGLVAAGRDEQAEGGEGGEAGGQGRLEGVLTHVSWTHAADSPVPAVPQYLRTFDDTGGTHAWKRHHRGAAVTRTVERLP